MLVRDEQTVAQDREMQIVEEQRHRTHAWLREQLETSVYVENTGNDRTNAERQIGFPLSVSEVERRLKRLVPQLHFENTLNPTKKYMFLRKPDGALFKIMLYESGINGPIPEHSIMRAVIKEDLDPDVVKSKFHLDRKDLPKHEVRPHEFNEDGSLKKEGDVIWDDTVPMLGMKRTKREWSEQVRGYRTMAAMLVSMGLTTPDAVERAFGAADRPEWAASMGKRARSTPW